LSELGTCLSVFPVVCADVCVGVTVVSAGPTARLDSSGKQVCELCGRRLTRVGATHPQGPGRACHPRCKGTPTSYVPRKCQAHAHYHSESTPSSLLTAAAPQLAMSKPRSTRPYDTLGATQQRERRKRARASLEEIGCPVEALQPSVPSPSSVLHLPTSIRH